MSEFELGSGNVFADLGLPAPDEALFKSELAMAIKSQIEKRQLTQTQAAQIMNETQPNVSAIMRGRLRNFSLERLLHHLRALGMDIEVTLKESATDGGLGGLSLKAG